MSLDTVQVAPEQPAPVAQISSEKKTGNTSISDFARKIAGAQQPPASFAPKVEAKPVATEEAKAPPAETKTEEPKEEAKAETPEATEDEGSEVLSPETHNLDPKLQEKINKRIGKEVAKRKALEAKVATLEAIAAEKPAEVEKEVVVPVPSNQPLAEYTSLEALNQYKENLVSDIIEAEGLMYSDFPAEGLDTKWGKVTKPQLASMITAAKKEERMAIPQREKFLATRTQATQTANEKFPFLKDPTSEGYKMAKQALRENPVLRNYPNSEYLVGMIVKGQLAMREEEAKTETKAPAKPKPQPTKGQSEIASDASITRAPTGVVNNQALQAEITKITGGKKSLNSKEFAAVLQAKQRFRNSQ